MSLDRVREAMQRFGFLYPDKVDNWSEETRQVNAMQGAISHLSIPPNARGRLSSREPSYRADYAAYGAASQADTKSYDVRLRLLLKRFDDANRVRT